MSSIAKVNLITELGLLPLKRYIQRKPDNYQKAAQEYSSQLVELYQLNLKDRKQVLKAQKLAIETETFRLNHTAGELNGITIDKKSLPGAQLNDHIVLIRQDETNKGEPLVRGVIVKITDQQIRIKFDEAIFKKPSEQPDEQKEQSVPDESEAAGPSAESKQENKEPATSQEDVESNQNTTIDFRIKFDLKGDKIDIRDDHSTVVAATLIDFEKLKCNQAIQRSLLGYYDERSDTLNDKARVMVFTELVLKLNSQQRTAIESALKRRITLIEGPAGTGKTVVGAHIAANVGRQRRARVLVCSPIQETVDKLTELIDRVGGVQVVKLPTRTQTSDREVRSARMQNGVTGRRRDSYLRSETKQSNHCHLDKLVDDEIYLQAYARFKDTLGDNHDKLHAQAYRMVTSCSEMRRRELETKIISKANVVCCKINQTASSLLKGIEFDMLILDDVQVTSELDCLVAIMTRGIKQVTLLSDTRREIRLARILKRSQSVCHSNNGTNAKQHQVLRTNSLKKKREEGSIKRRQRPVSTASENVSPQSQRAGLSRPYSPLSLSLEPGNLFERLLSLGLPSIDLRTQYRCHATLSNFFIHHFYAGRLKDDPETNDKMSAEIVTRLMVDDDSFSWLPNKKYLTAIYTVPSDSNPATAATDTSQTIVERSKVIEGKVDELIENLFSNENIRKGEYNIGVIYNNQAQSSFSEGHRADVKRGTIESFIGQECDFIILVCTRSHASVKSDSTNAGICSSIPRDFKRSDTALNWALTRARLGLFIVSDDKRCTNASETHDGDQTQVLPRDNDCKSWRELVKYYAANDLIVE